MKESTDSPYARPALGLDRPDPLDPAAFDRRDEVGEFAHLIGSELQAPLRKLVAIASLLPQDPGDDLPDRVRQDLGSIADTAARMLRVVQDLLALSRLGRAPLHCDRVPLDYCADRALEALLSRVRETHAEMTRDPLPEVWGDWTMLARLYQHLLANALASSGRLPPVIRLTAQAAGGRIICGVRDNGRGIPPEYAEQVFAPLKRLPASGEGTGIGLAICRKIVERHGGRIWVESAPGKGAHFRFALPQGPDW